MQVERKCLNAALWRAAVLDAFRKLHPSVQVKSPVMFAVYVGAILTTGIALKLSLIHIF